MYYRLVKLLKKSAVRVKASIKYDSIDAFENPFILESAEFSIYEGKKLFDIVRYCEVLNFAISKKVKNILEENYITGWGCYPIKINNVEEEYFRFYVTGKPVHCINRDEDGLIPMFVPILFMEEERDKSDIFNIADTGVIVCVPKVKELFEKHKITNVEFTPL